MAVVHVVKLQYSRCDIQIAIYHDAPHFCIIIIISNANFNFFLPLMKK